MSQALLVMGISLALSYFRSRRARTALLRADVVVCGIPQRKGRQLTQKSIIIRDGPTSGQPVSRLAETARPAK
jgi:hypothetical protein